MIRICEDCGNTFPIDTSDSRIRCETCQEIHLANYTIRKSQKPANYNKEYYSDLK